MPPMVSRAGMISTPTRQPANRRRKPGSWPPPGGCADPGWKCRDPAAGCGAALCWVADTLLCDCGGARVCPLLDVDFTSLLCIRGSHPGGWDQPGRPGHFAGEFRHSQPSGLPDLSVRHWQNHCPMPSRRLILWRSRLSWMAGDDQGGGTCAGAYLGSGRYSTTLLGRYRGTAVPGFGLLGDTWFMCMPMIIPRFLATAFDCRC